MKPTNIQRILIEDILNELGENSVSLESPAGSGKTYILYRVAGELLKKGKIVIVMTLPNGGLNKDLESSMRKFNKKDGDYTFKTTPLRSLPKSEIYKKTNIEHNLTLEEGNLYVVEGQQVDRGTTLGDYALEKSVRRSYYKGKKVILVRDESHMKNPLWDRLKKYSHRFIEIIATQKKEKMISNIISKVNIKSKNNNDLLKSKSTTTKFANEIDLLNRFYSEYMNVAEQYEESYRVKPLALVSAPYGKEGRIQYNKILNYFEGTGLKYIDYSIWKGDNKKITSYDSDIDLIIFNNALPSDFNVPRACFLLRLKKIKSEILSSQLDSKVKINMINKEDGLAERYWVYELKEN